MSEEVGEYLDHILSPDLYMHLVILEAIRAPHRALTAGDPRSGIVSLILAVDQLEKIAIASRKLTEKDYNEYVAKVSRFENDLNEKDELLRRAQLANYKLQLLLSYIFKRQPQALDLTI